MSQVVSQQEVKKSLQYSLWDGVAFSLTTGFTEIYLIPCALVLGARDILLGVLSTFPLLAGDLSQLSTPALVKQSGSRKGIVLLGIAGQAVMIALIAGLFNGKHRLYLFLLLMTFYWISGMIALPAWQSWMGDLVPKKMRGAFFAQRNRIIQWVTFGALLSAGWILNYFENPGRGFFILFSIGFVGRILSLAFVRKQSDFSRNEEEKGKFTYLQFLRTIHQHNYGRFVLYTALFSLSLNIAGPYFIPYMLEDLKFSYWQFTITIATMIGFKSLTLPLWGHLSDRYGSRKLFALATILFCIPPLLWLISRNFYYLVAIQTVAGLASGGFELCSFNLLLDITEPNKRTRSAAYYQVSMGICILIGALIGGLLLRSPFWGGQSYLLLFLISGLLRIVLSTLFLPKIRETRPVEPITYRQLLLRLTGWPKTVIE